MPRSMFLGGGGRAPRRGVSMYGTYLESMWHIIVYQFRQEMISCKDHAISVACRPCLMNPARLHKVFQNFVVPWKKDISQNLNIIRHISTRHVKSCKGCLCQFWPQMGPMTWLKIMSKLQQIPKYAKIDETPVNHPSDWAPATSWSWRWQRNNTPRMHVK